jgi:BioD-like phosphotransacetylase family protein
MLERVGPQTLVIVPGDREDVILAITTTHDNGPSSEGTALGLVLTGGYRPRQAVLDAIRRADLFATLVGADTYAVASEVHDLLVKTHPSDHGKITEIKDLVWEHLEIDRVLEVATTARV